MAAEKLSAITAALGIARDRIVRTAELKNGPVWQALELKSADDVLAVDSSKVRYPQFVGIGLVGAHAAGADCNYEVRMLAPSSGMSEDPITGSLNAAVACWMYSEGHWQAPVKVAQGTRINRTGRIHIRRDAATDIIWIGGETRMLIEGTLTL